MVSDAFRTSKFIKTSNKKRTFKQIKLVKQKNANRKGLSVKIKS